MKKKWFTFAFAVLTGAAFFSLPNEERQSVAKYIMMCLLLAFLIRPVGLTLGQILRKVLRRE